MFTIFSLQISIIIEECACRISILINQGRIVLRIIICICCRVAIAIRRIAFSTQLSIGRLTFKAAKVQCYLVAQFAAHKYT